MGKKKNTKKSILSRGFVADQKIIVATMILVAAVVGLYIVATRASTTNWDNQLTPKPGFANYGSKYYTFSNPDQAFFDFAYDKGATQKGTKGIVELYRYGSDKRITGPIARKSFTAGQNQIFLNVPGSVINGRTKVIATIKVSYGSMYLRQIIASGGTAVAGNEGALVHNAYDTNPWPCNHGTTKQGHYGMCVSHLKWNMAIVERFDGYPQSYFDQIKGDNMQHFDADLTTAVRYFQGRKGLAQDGIAGASTWNALHAACEYIKNVGGSPNCTGQ